MYFFKSILVFATTAALVSATPGVDKRTASGLVARQFGNNCDGNIGNCFQNGCEGMFARPSDTVGWCSAGTFNGCPCNKCGSGGNFIGRCSDNGCNGFEGTCTAGTFQGCPCN